MSDHDEPRLGEFLAGLREKGDGFRTPSPELLEAMAGRALTKARRPAKVRSLQRAWWSVAAAVMLLLVAVFLLPPADDAGMVADEKKMDNPSSQALLAELEAEDIDAYISDQLEHFESELYASAPVNE